MALTCFGLAALAAALFYRNWRDKEIIAETLEYYSELASDLTQQIKKQRELSSFLAHDLKSPLAGIISSAQALELAGKELPSSYLECLRLMQVSGRANLRLLSNYIEIVGDSANRQISTQLLPENRLDLLRGLLESTLIKEGKVIWQAAPWLLKTDITFKPFSNALAEIISIIVGQEFAEQNKWALKIEESFDADSKQLRISMHWPAAISTSCYAPAYHPYSLAIEVMEKIGVSVSSIEQFELGNTLELLLPISEYAAMSQAHVEQRDAKAAEAEMLIEISMRQIKSASLSVGSLSDLRRVDDDNSNAEAVQISDSSDVKNAPMS